MKKIAFVLLSLAGLILLTQIPRLYQIYQGYKPTFSFTEAVPNLSQFKADPSQNESIPALSLVPYVTGLQKPRDLQFTPGGTLLVSLLGEGQVVAIWGKSADGKATNQQIVLSHLHNPHGLAIANGKLFVAEQTVLNRYAWNEETKTAVFEKKLFDLPAGGRHITRSVVIDESGKLYLTIGSTCDVCIEKDPWISTVISSNTEGEDPQVMATGLRNSVFLALQPETNQLWATEMGRDMIGNDIPPDEVNIIRDGQNYGWPFCYGDRIFDKKSGVGGEAGQCTQTQAPAFKIQAHSAPLGLAFIPTTGPLKAWAGDLVVAYHGSWNRTPPSGYKIVKLDVEESEVKTETVLFDFLAGTKSSGRPVDVTFDSEGELFFSDDAQGVIYHVAAES
jgi:glucose/arabinose dehydrogenase